MRSFGPLRGETGESGESDGEHLAKTGKRLVSDCLAERASEDV